ncbi:GntR family transcriptional regulator [Streptomyces sp. NBC_00237]|uniref:GntR family transcriptional regulator n=1 Tax=Streptomyces sp. NBC_00237 TaxID=2975687 RepID=UPI00225C3BDA|nr:GntR family transcriptional regulator [Streptomyces sp. NBC_00237]MCX5206242.1 GntR family transcriptional regulator [Streptomyces sp. NBC_00237]
MTDSRPAAAPTTRLRSVSLREQAREELRARITLGQIEPGKVRSVISIAEELGVSITPVREAVMDLANQGMVEVIRNRGFRVPQLSEHDLDEIFRIRTLLEAPAMADVVRVLGGARVPEFRRLAEEITSAARKGDLAAFLDKDRQFHLGLLELLGNGRLVAMVAQLRDQARMRGLQKLADQGELTQSGEEHITLIDAIEAGQAELAVELMRDHLAHSRGIWAGHAEPAS